MTKKSSTMRCCTKSRHQSQVSFCFRAHTSVAIKVRKHSKIKDDCCLALGFMMERRIHSLIKQTVGNKELGFASRAPVSSRFVHESHSIFPVFDSPCSNCSTESVKSCFLGAFPIFSWLHAYKKDDFIGDLISGITVAIMHIPQGMGYALLASLPPVTGIYMAFFPVLMYVVFGTSRHNSMGKFTVF